MRWARISIKLGVTVSGVWAPVSGRRRRMYLSSPDTADCSLHRSCVDILIKVDISTLSRYTYLYHISIVFDILRQIARYCQAAHNNEEWNDKPDRAA